MLDSLVIRCGTEARVPAGDAFAVDRDRFSAAVTSAIANQPNITLHRDEVTSLDRGDYDFLVVATGPLTSQPLFDSINDFLGRDGLYFYDAIAPILAADSLDMSKLYWKSRYGKGSATDYLNAPMTQAAVRGVRGRAAVRRDLRAARFRKGRAFRRMPAGRGDRLARHRHAALRSDEAGRTRASGHRRASARGRAAAQGRPVRRLLQHRRLPDEDESAGAEARHQHDSRPGERRLRALRLDAPQHVHQRPAASARDVSDEDATTAFSSPARSPASKATWSRPPSACSWRATSTSSRTARAATPLPFHTALGALGRHVAESSPDRYQPSNVTWALIEDVIGRCRKIEKRERQVATALESVRALCAAA